MKKILLNLIISIMMLTSVAFASDNNLSSIVLEGTPNGYNLTLRADNASNIKKTVISEDTMLVEVKNISSSVNLDTKYINTQDINNLVVENSGNNVKIYIQGKNVDKANIIFDTPASSPIVVSDGLSKKEIGWIAAAFLLIFAICGSFRKSVEKDDKISYQQDLTEREIKMYKELKYDIMTSAKIDHKLRYQLQKRNMQRANHHNETIRSLQKMACK